MSLALEEVRCVWSECLKRGLDGWSLIKMDQTRRRFLQSRAEEIAADPGTREDGGDFPQGANSWDGSLAEPSALRLSSLLPFPLPHISCVCQAQNILAVCCSNYFIPF